MSEREARSNVEAEIANLNRLRERCSDGTEWARWIDNRLAWLHKALTKFTDTGKS